MNAISIAVHIPISILVLRGSTKWSPASIAFRELERLRVADFVLAEAGIMLITQSLVTECFNSLLNLLVLVVSLNVVIRSIGG